MRRGHESPFGWQLVLAAAPIGVVFAALTIAGALPGVQATRWTALGLIAIVGMVVGLRAQGRQFRHGLAAGFISALAAIWSQALFLETYFANNPEYAEIEIPFGLPPRMATFVLGPLNAIFAGLLTGLVAWASRKMAGARLKAGS